MKSPKLNIKKILFAICWAAIGVSSIVLLVAAVRSKEIKTCKGIAIEISGVSNNFFIDKTDVLEIIKNFTNGKPEGKSLTAFNLGAIEKKLQKNEWIKNAELYFDNNEILRVSIDEREPVARIFSLTGKSFYIDSSLRVLPLSEKFSARLPVFTGFMHNPEFLSKSDSSLLRDIKQISIALEKDSFLMAMIDQVDITAQHYFEMIPKIGNQIIVFGNAENVTEKFNKLRLFYKTIMVTVGWNKYSIINLQYKDQVVAKIKDAIDKTSDSLRALQIMQVIAERSARLAADSIQFSIKENDRANTDSTMIQQSVQRDDEQEQGVEPVSTSATNSAAPVVTNNVKLVQKPATRKLVKPVTPAQSKPPAQKPKAVMGN